MAFLARALRLNNFKCSINVVTRVLSSLNTANSSLSPLASLTHVKENPWIYKQPDAIKIPVVPNNTRIDLPNGLIWVPILEKEAPKARIEIPPTQDTTEKQAARLIVIRRKKMKKHKLRKLRKRMKYEWAKVRQRRELKKEKDFQAGLIQQCKEAEAFSAEKYVEEKLGKLNEIIIPRTWKGKRLPEFIIREKMGLPPKNS